MPVSSRGPRRRRSWWCHTCSSTPGTRTPAKTGRVIRCGSQTRLDMGPHGIPRGATYPASLKPPQPFQDPGPGCVDHLHHHTPVALSKSPRNQGTPSWLHDSTSSTRVSGVRATLIRWKPSKPTSRSHRSSDTQQQVGPDTARGPLKTAGVEVRSSPGTSTSTRNPQPTPTHPHSTRKSRFDRGPGSARGRLRHARARVAAPEDERIKRDGQGPARPGRSAPRTHAPRPRGGGGARRGACAPRSRHPCVT